MGIHNVLEAAVWSIPVIFGPNNKHFQEAQGLLMAQGGYEINNYQEFAELMNRFDNDADFLKQSGEKAGQFVKSRAGTTRKIIENIKEL